MKGRDCPQFHQECMGMCYDFCSYYGLNKEQREKLNKETKRRLKKRFKKQIKKRLKNGLNKELILKSFKNCELSK